MMRLCLSLAVAALVAAPLLCDAEVMRVRRSAILIGTHNDITGPTIDGLDIGQLKTDHHAMCRRMLT